MQFYLAFVAGNGKEYLRHAMADVIPDDIAYEEHCQAYTHNGEDQVKPVGSSGGEAIREQMFDVVDNPFQCPSGQGGKDAHHKTDE